MKVKKIFIMLLILLFTNIYVQNVSVAGQAVGVLEDEYYYIKNVDSGLYLSIDTSNDNVYLAPFSDAKTQKWKFKWKSGDVYVVIPQYDTAKRLDVLAASNKQNANVDIYAKTSASDQEWKISRHSTNSSYTLRSGCSSYTKYLTAAGSMWGANVVQSDEYTMNQRLWTLEKVSKGWSDHFPSNIIGNLDTTTFNSSFSTYCSKMGYNVYQQTNSTAGNAYNMMYDDIWVYNGHGSDAEVSFFTSAYESNGRIVADDSQKSSTKDRAVYNQGTDFACGNRCTLLIACLSGKSLGTKNLVDAIYESGSHFVLGATDIRYDTYDTMWLEAFFKACSESKTIGQALNAANVASPKSSNYYSRGNTQQKLCP